jgi:uncharacterized C2H2 Zn-finger protein
MACEKPLLVLSGEGTPLVNFLKDKGCAKLITEQDYEKKVNETVSWLQHVTKEQLRIMGKKGLSEIQERYSKDKVTGLYENLLEELM